MFRNNLRFLIVLTIAAFALSVAPACATTITTYNDLASWQAASSGVQWINFENGSLTNNLGVSFSGMAGGTLGIMDTIANSWANFNTGKAAFINMNQTPSPLPYIHLAFNPGVTAFAVNVFTANPHALSFTVSVNGTPFTVPTNDIGGSAAFFGVTSDTPFIFIDLKLLGTTGNSGAYEFIDNVRFGTSQVDQTPEAATFLLIGSGLVGLMALRKRIVQRGRRLTV